MKCQICGYADENARAGFSFFFTLVLGFKKVRLQALRLQDLCE